MAHHLPYPSPARVGSGKIVAFGLLLTGLACVSPLLLLILTAVLAIILPVLYRENDDGENRRKLYNEFLQREDLPERVRCKDVNLNERYWTNDRGMLLLTSIMTPKGRTRSQNEPKGVILFCHGYQDNPSFLKRMEYQRFVKAGFAVVMIEYEGHGRSDGPNALIPCFDTLLNDVHAYFKHIVETEFPTKKKFLMGESMGGAVAYSLIQNHGDFYDGVILVAPMVKIQIAPPDWITNILSCLLGKSGTVDSFTILPIAPSKGGDIASLSFRDEKKLLWAKVCPTKHDRKPRLATARELLGATRKISASLGDFDAPFLVQHGLEDFVTCPKISEALYRESQSEDKTLKLYQGMRHNLTAGELDENIDTVFDDAIAWALARC